MLAMGRLPRDKANAIKTYESGLRANPNIAIQSLSDRRGNSVQETVLDTPCRVHILRDVMRRLNGNKTVRRYRHSQEKQP